MMQAELERLASRVRAAARDDGLIETAQVKLVGLDEVRAAAGSRWPRMREHVREGSLKIIVRRIGAEDGVIPCGDGFLVVFAHASPEQTQARCAEIREALLAFYLGEEALSPLRANVARETVSASHLAGIVSQEPSAQAPLRRNELRLGRFWPIWSMRRMSIAAFMCAPGAAADAGLRQCYEPGFLDSGRHGKDDYLDLDLCLLEQACAAAEMGAAPIGFSVHASTMQARKSRSIFLDHLAANASPAYQRMFACIAEIQPGTPLISLTEWTRLLKTHLPRVMLDMHHSDRAIGALAATGAWAAGYHLAGRRLGSNAEVRAALNELDGWCRSLRRQGLMPLVNGFQDEALLDLAGYSDLAFASGEKLWPSQPQPGALGAGAHAPCSQILERAPA